MRTFESLFICLCAVQFLHEIVSGKIQCPDFCDCDYFQQLKRAVCQDKKLISLDLDIPKQAQILDVSFNHIRGIDEKIFIFTNLTELRLLNISYNKINHIHFKGFEGLNELKSLDLSYNALEYFTESWFEQLPKLEELYLRGNKLKDINNQPRINIQKLKVLDISSCGIISLKSNIFIKIPNLTHLDISDNYIQNLDTSVITPLKKLINFQAKNNAFGCKELKIKELIKYTSKMSIVFTHDCPPNNPDLVMFERMVLDDEKNSNDKNELLKNSWINEEQDVVSITDKNITKAELMPKRLFYQLIEDYPISVIVVTFFHGFFCGMIAVNFCNFCYYGKKTEESSNSSSTINLSSRNRLKNRSKSSLFNGDTIRRTMPSVFDSDAYQESLIMNESFNLHSTPMTGRRNIVQMEF